MATRREKIKYMQEGADLATKIFDSEREKLELRIAELELEILLNKRKWRSVFLVNSPKRIS